MPEIKFMPYHVFGVTVAALVELSIRADYEYVAETDILAKARVLFGESAADSDSFEEAVKSSLKTLLTSEMIYSGAFRPVIDEKGIVGYRMPERGDAWDLLTGITGHEHISEIVFLTVLGKIKKGAQVSTEAIAAKCQEAMDKLGLDPSPLYKFTVDKARKLASVFNRNGLLHINLDTETQRTFIELTDEGRKAVADFISKSKVLPRIQKLVDGLSDFVAEAAMKDTEEK